VADLGWVVAGIAQQLTSERVRNVCRLSITSPPLFVSYAQQNISARLILPLLLALNVPRHPLNLLLRTTWTPELCPKLCRTLPPWSKCLLVAWPMSCRLCDFLNIAVANSDSKVMSFAFLRTSSLLYQFCPVSPLMLTLTLAFWLRTSNNYPTTAHYSCG